MVLVVIILIVLAFVAVSSAVFPFRETLRRASLETQEGRTLNEYTVNFFDRQDRRIAAVTVQVMELNPSTPMTEDQYRMHVNVWHAHEAPAGTARAEDLQEDTYLESLRLYIDAGEASSTVRLAVPGGYPWQPMLFHRAQNGDGVVLDIPDLGFQGRGTVALDFLVGDAGLPPPEQFSVDVAFEMYPEQGLKLTKQTGQTTITVQLPTSHMP